ncbi:hypothetical protein OIU34_21050 [Pararhizobium sp. BT-229]|uniref:hypothetical protein n=1 Tax=Pararhizobium sp. BT-229 TaxID=2986923 RepID=UPI0021F7595F|nr:hypothetical protein [Pararhizobium sp. BT-229]MCV9964379.1 hypothetical protein [Pararhizobium sp. BT-229]
MANQAQNTVEYSSPIEYVWDGAIVAPAVVFGSAKAGSKVDLIAAATWAQAARRSLRRPSETIRLGDTGGPD